jgi:HEPN domain-containing protein
MGAPRSAEAKPFYRASYQRLEDSRILLENGRTTGAVYLAGYGVECILKVLLLERTPKSSRAAVLMSFRGQIGHNFDWLKHELSRTDFSEARQSSVMFLRLRDWSTDLRYSTKQTAQRDAVTFLRAAEKIIEWIERQL